MGEQLVAVADPQYGCRAPHRAAQPCRGAFAPGFALRNHGARSGDHDTRETLRVGKLLSLEDRDHRYAVSIEAHPGADPILEIAAFAGQRRECTAGLDDQ